MFAAEAAAVTYLRSLKLKVPITFGNVDLTVIGSPKKIERRLEYLTTALVKLCKVSELREPYKVVTLDDSMGDGLLSPNGGLGGAVGNVLTYDEETEMLQFCNDFTSLPHNAKALLLKLRNQIDNLHEYRFHVKTTRLPKLILQHSVYADVAKEFLSKLVVFAKQQNHFAVEETLKKEIQDRLSANSHKLSIKSDSVFLHYHNKIQKMWMSPKTGEYLTKTSNLYEQAIDELITEAQISALETTFYMNNVKYCGYSFVEEATKWMELPELPSTMFIVTDTVTLTTMKVTQCLRHHYAINKYTVLDLEHVLNLSKADFSSLNAELRKTENVVIIVCSTHHNSSSSIKLYDLTQSTKEKNTIVIANKVFMEKINEWLPSTSDVFEDETQLLTALTLSSQMEVTQNVTVMFQDRELSLNLLLDEVSVAFVKAAVLDTVIRNETINMGRKLSNSKYEEYLCGKNVYMDRRVSPVDIESTFTSNDSKIDDTGLNEEVSDDASDSDMVRTFNDVKEDVVLLTGPPGMGKSTLLTHLALTTTNQDMSLWIIRVNVLEHSKQFYKWYEEKRVVDPLESLTFLCQVALGNKDMTISIEITNDEARLVNCTGDELDAFELNMFLHFYNKKKVIFIFDGFDEICPYYKDKVLDLIDVARTRLRKNKMWVSSRPYSDILPDLERVVGRRFELKPFTEFEQDVYLRCFWSQNIIYKQHKNKLLIDLMNSTLNAWVARPIGLMAGRSEWMRRNCYSFYQFLHNLFYENNSLMHPIPKPLRTYRAIEYDSKDYDLGIPLLLYFVADYFANLVNIDGNDIEPQVEINSSKIYEVFVENKIKKILLQDKNNMDLCNPITRNIFEKELARCVTVHKRLAAHTLLQGPVFEAMDIEEFQEMSPISQGVDDIKALLSDIRRGADKIGLVSNVTADGVPIFIHRSFLEYFCAGYVCDILRSDKFNLKQKVLLHIAIAEHCPRGIDWIHIQKELDKELVTVSQEILNVESRCLYVSALPSRIHPDSISKSQLLRINCSTRDDYEIGFFEGHFLKDHGSTSWYSMDVDCCAQFCNHILSDLITHMKAGLKKHFVEESKSKFLSRYISGIKIKEDELTNTTLYQEHIKKRIVLLQRNILL